MLVAMAEAVSERGIATVSVAEIVSRAGVSRRTFYEAFADRDDCLLAALEYALERVERVVLPAWGEQTRWREAMRAGLAALLSFLDEEPVLGSLLLLDWPLARGLADERRSSLMSALVAAVDGGRPFCKAGREPSPLIAEGVVGALLAVLRARLAGSASFGSLADVASPGSATVGVGGARASSARNGSGERAYGVSGMLGELMAIVVLPYLGQAAASRESSRPAPPPAPKRAHASTEALRGLKIRLTYRTVMVLRFVGRNPGSSNRQIATGSGISDQGQVSKLLTRLAKAGLIENERRLDPARDCNAWRLTPTGAAVERATSRGEVAGALSR